MLIPGTFRKAGEAGSLDRIRSHFTHYNAVSYILHRLSSSDRERFYDISRCMAYSGRRYWPGDGGVGDSSKNLTTDT